MFDPIRPSRALRAIAAEAERRRLWSRVLAHMNPTVFFGSAALVVAFVAFGAGFTDSAAAFFLRTQEGAARYFGWWYVLVATGLLAFAALLLASPRARRVRLGGREARPEFSRAGWFAMLFAAGMGVGLVYFGVAEPLMHLGDPLFAEPNTDAAAREAIRLSFFHWGLHAWGIYVIFALAVAHAHFNRGLPLAPRSALEPLIGDRIRGPIGDGVDILCTVGTLLGVATSLGLGAMQINASLEQFFGAPESTLVQTALIAAITAVATVSVVLGVARGVQRLSQLNIGLAGLLLLFMLVAGPTLYIVETLITGVGLYLQNLPRMSFYLDPGAGSPWQTTWTLFYWGWWISWAPFVAIFVARVSRGRTVREFILGVLLAPVATTFLWLSAFGGTGLWLQRVAEDGADLAAAIDRSVSSSLQAMLSAMPFGGAATVLATVVIALFFVTSSDSGSLVDDMVTSGGDPHPPKAQRVFWAVSEGAVAITLLLLGGLDAIRNAAISLGLPMSLVLVATAVGLWRALGRPAPEPAR
jgi:choline/glycine/proline betaine transport protein